MYHAVLDEICDGVLPPGTHLKQEQLAARFGVSRQPIQQAMALLKADGLVEEIGMRGLRVAALDLALMRHHYDIRAALDGLAARRAAERSHDDLKLAREARTRGGGILKAGRQAVVHRVVREQIRHDEAFHNLLYELSGNPLLAPTAQIHWRFLRRVMGDVLRHAAAPRTIWRQHGEILKSIVAGDPARAEALAVQHIQVAAQALATAMTDEARAAGASAV